MDSGNLKSDLARLNSVRAQVNVLGEERRESQSGRPQQVIAFRQALEAVRARSVAGGGASRTPCG